MPEKDASEGERPTVFAYFADLDEQAVPLLAALGRAVMGVAALEANLRLELARLLTVAHTSEEDQLPKRLGEIEKMTGGQLLRELGKLDLPEDLQARIDDVVARRNRLVHHLFEQPEMIGALEPGPARHAAVEQIDRLSLDCGSLAVELQTFALSRLEDATGRSKEELMDLVLSADPGTLDGVERTELERAQRIGIAIGGQGALEARPSDHRITVDWMGERFETLADLLRPGLRAVCIGINPSLVSVEAGHYYQGRLGRRFWQRLHRAGVIEEVGSGTEDVEAFVAGIGFTDVVKRPTARAGELTAAELRSGRDQLAEKLGRYRPPLLIFTFKKSAEALFGRFQGDGHRADLQFSDAQVFVMPGPYAKAEDVTPRLEELRELLFAGSV
ncbi:MAG TPA: mismatch-specific DNA-glycosylase [Solirubrobacterales bacterium]|nr:mismatch-specific DNA-glycosylase [Solirubrobacterales bacterium]